MIENKVNPVKRAYRRYVLEFTASMAAYTITILISRWLLRGPMQSASENSQIVIAVLPIVPIVFVFTVIVRLLRGTDERYRRICVDSIAIAGGVTALLAVTYGLIEGDRFPHLSAWWSYITFMVAWLIAQFFVGRQYR